MNENIIKEGLQVLFSAYDKNKILLIARSGNTRIDE